ncbi:hypothetical protein NQ314_013687 [Rhamnusium bicolor]|uniref:Uncharacterized protein n=1 Tax=Rhamnusium bicolor TaxID=1586634 RepID=A0AAV8X605_9CUCU|nr:hypothetical protein NQ314_013687 [Rhamnusium bicolor]
MSKNEKEQRKPACDEDQLVAFLADIQIINPESIVELAVDSLEPMCRKLCVNLDKLDEYLKTCKLQSQVDLYMSLIAGVKVLRDKLCTDSDFYRRKQVEL